MQHGVIQQISDTDAAYIAGLIDADGCVTCGAPDRRKNRKSNALVIITNSDFELIEWLKGVIGAGTSSLTKTRPYRAGQDRTNWNAVHRYQLTGRKAAALIERVLPYMRIKRQQAKLLIEIPMRGRDFSREATPEQLERAASIVDQLRALNRRGLKQPLYAPAVAQAAE